MLNIKGSLDKVAEAVLIIDLHDDGTYTITKNREGTGAYINQLILVNKDGLVERVKGKVSIVSG